MISTGLGGGAIKEAAHQARASLEVGHASRSWRLGRQGSCTSGTSQAKLVTLVGLDGRAVKADSKPVHLENMQHPLLAS